MNKLVVFILMLVLSNAVFAEGINERTHPDPGAQAKINRVMAQAWSTQPPTDHIAVYNNATPGTTGVSPQSVGTNGINVGLSVGTVSPGANGQTPRENNVVTGDNIVICLHCRGN